MVVFIFIIGSLSVLILSCLLAKTLSGKKPVTWMDKDFQVWAFGHVLPEKIPLNHITHLWNKRNPEHKISVSDDFAHAISEMLALYNNHRK